MSSIHLYKEQENLILKNLNTRDNSLQLYEEPGLDDENFPNIKKVVDRINRTNSETITYEGRRHELPIHISKLVVVNIDGLTKFPQSICGVRNLTELIFTNNKISGLPKCIGSLTHLSMLILNNNELTHLPNSIGALIHLTKLELNENKLTALPESIGALSNLSNLSLERNELTVLPESIGNLLKLEYLNVAHNQLHEIPDSICELGPADQTPNLNFLGLENNKLVRLPDNMQNLVNLEYLNVDDNPELNVLPQTIGYYGNRITVYIYGTGFYEHFLDNPVPFSGNVNFEPFIPAPEFPEEEEAAEAPPAAVVDAMEVHRKSASVRYEDLVQFLKEKTGKELAIAPENFGAYIKNSIIEIIHNCYRRKRRRSHRRTRSIRRTRNHGGTRSRSPIENNSEEKEELLSGLNNIMEQRLAGINYAELSPLVIESMFYTLEYVKMQDVAFQKPYVKAFVKDCITAYEGTGEEAMTCAAGAMERIVLSLEIACTQNSSPDNQRILSYLIDPNEFIIQWYKEHKGCAGFPKESWNDDGFKTNSLKEYLLDKVRGSKPDEFNKLIEDTKAAIGMECPDDFGYGTTPTGGKKKSRKTRKLAK
jgi:Leucine-rich repeat (LRR) protein